MGQACSTVRTAIRAGAASSGIIRHACVQTAPASARTPLAVPRKWTSSEHVAQAAVWGSSQGTRGKGYVKSDVRVLWQVPVTLHSRVHELVWGAGCASQQRAFSSPAEAEAGVVAADAGESGKRKTPGRAAEAILHKAPHHGFPRARAVRKRFKTSVKKLNLVCKLVRRARVDAALMQLSLTDKRVADTVRRTIYDAKFNAANNHGMDPDRLLIDEILVGRCEPAPGRAPTRWVLQSCSPLMNSCTDGHNNMK